MAARGARLQPNNTNSTADFQIPSRERKILPITAPQTQPQQSKPPSKIISRPSTNSSTSTSASASSQDAKPRVSLPVQESTPATPIALNNQTTQVSEPDRLRVPLQSSLDIHSRKYVPLWLRAVNDSVYLSVRQGRTLQTQNFPTYISSFAGSGFLQPVVEMQMPHPIPIELSHEKLTVDDYAVYWTQRLQNEFAAQNIQNQFFALYEKSLTVYNPQEHLFMLNVPGLRENAPRLDVGDVVHLRPLHNEIPADIMTQTAYWNDQGKKQGYLAPGFSGFLIMATVWGMNRGKEEVILRANGLDGYLKCNVIFPLQASKLEPVWRVVQKTNTNLVSNVWLHKVLFPEEKDGVIQTTLSQATFGIDWVDDVLNWEQKKAIHSVLSKNYGGVPYLISGPPGTGKTKTLVELALQFLRQSDRHHNLLICAPSDAAADTLASRLSRHLQPQVLFRLNSWTRTFAELPDHLLPYTHTENDLFALPQFVQMMSFRVVVTTCRDADILVKARLTNGALSHIMSNMNRLVSSDETQPALHWTALLLDEAAQATEPDVMIPMSVVMPPSASDEVPQFVAAGDQYQLGPKLLTKTSLSTSLFQRLFEREAYAGHPLSRDKGLVTVLTSKMLPMVRPAFTNLVRNYRSHPAILSVPSMLFYNDTLITERKGSAIISAWPGWSSPPAQRWPVMFYQNDGDDMYESVTEGDGTGSGALYNPQEAQIALKLAISLLRHASASSSAMSDTVSTSSNIPLHPRDIMIMSPFRAQVTHLRTVFRKAQLYDINIGPLEAFQGLESRIVIICTTRTRLGNNINVNLPQHPSHYVRIDQSRGLGIIDEPQRFNVAVTRAKEGLIVIGNSTCLQSTNDRQWTEFLAFCRRNSCYQRHTSNRSDPSTVTFPRGSNSNDTGSTGAGVINIGRLEKALIYAARGKMLAEQQENGTTTTTMTTTTTTANKKFSLKGPRVEMDEEMWRFKELAQRRDREDVDWFAFDDDDGDNDDNHEDDDDSDEGDEGDEDDEDEDDEDENDDDAVGDEDETEEEGWDRNLLKEFHEGCANQ